MKTIIPHILLTMTTQDFLIENYCPTVAPDPGNHSGTLQNVPVINKVELQKCFQLQNCIYRF